jgi:hypothetical protein
MGYIESIEITGTHETVETIDTHETVETVYNVLILLTFLMF